MSLTGVKNTSDGSRNTAWDYVFSKAALAVAASIALDCQDVFSHASAKFTFPSAPGTISVNLEGSMDGSNWDVLATSTSTSTNTVTSAGTQFRLLRVNVTATTGGASPTITAIVAAQPQAFGGATSPTTTTANQGTPAAVGSAWPVKVTDGTSTAAVKAASTAAVAADPAVVVSLSPNSPTPLPALPSTANILAGSVATTGGTVITIPIGRIWVGQITLSASITGAAGAQTSSPTVTIVSSGTSFPVTTTVLAALQLTTGAGATANATAGQVTVGVTIAAPTAANNATVQLNNGGATAPTAMIATASGVLL